MWLRWVCLTGLVLALTSASPALVAQERPPVVRTKQSAAVLAKYPPLPIALDTPALRPGRSTYTTQAELETVLNELVASSPRAARLSLGTSPGGREVQALLLSREGAKTPGELAALGKPVVLLIGQQHGNEPAGGEAMIALAKALANGELTRVLDSLSVAIVPRANPDGAAADRRENAAGFDINRDHGVLSQPESRMVHELVRQIRPAMVIDAHEFTVGQRWLERYGGLEGIDLMVLSATHPMVPAPISKLSADLFQPAIEKAAAEWHLTSFVYHTMVGRGSARAVSVGGNAPGIARNAFGLIGAVSFLLETRGVGIGFDSLQRRVATHYIAERALLQAAATHAVQLAAVVTAARLSISQSHDDIIVAHTPAVVEMQLPLIDPATAVAKPTPVDLVDTRIITGLERRARPAGYIIQPERAGRLGRRLAMIGASTCLVKSAVAAAVERYDIVTLGEADVRAINPAASLEVRVRPAKVIVADGSLYVPLDQPVGTMVALALEPDTPGSLSAMELLEGGSSPSLLLTRLPASSWDERFAAALTCKH